MFALFASMIIAIGNDKTSLIAFFVFHLLLFSSILLLFYKLKIELYKDVLKLSFGIGVISKKYDIKNIDRHNIKEKKIPWYYGIGWRYDFKGNILFSAHFGTAVIFKLKDSNTKIMIVLKEREAFKTKLAEIVDKTSK
jgi:hypothetical protein